VPELVIDEEGGEDEGDEMGAAAAAARKAFRGRNRYDAAILRSEIASFDWRNDAPNPALGLTGPAVRKGRITFFTPAPSFAELLTFKEGGVSPFDFTAYAIRLAFRWPFEIGARFVEAEVGPPAVTAHSEIYVPRGIQIAQVIARGLFTLKVDKVPVCEDVPVDCIGGASGLLVQGSPVAGIGQNMGTSRKDHWSLPEPVELSPQGPRLEGWIDLETVDLEYLGEKSGHGVGEPMGDDRMWALEPGEVSVWKMIEIDPLPGKLSLEFWGRRGLNIQAGKIPSGPVVKK
jgi:hypothetical protein